MTFDKQSNSSRTAVESKSNRNRLEVVNTALLLLSNRNPLFRAHVLPSVPDGQKVEQLRMITYKYDSDVNLFHSFRTYNNKITSS